MRRQHREVCVAVEDGHPSVQGNRGNETVNQLPHGCPVLATLAIQDCGVLVVNRTCGEHGGAGQQPPEIEQVTLTASASQDLHANGITNCDFGPE